MKVSDIIRQLSTYPPDEELMIAWWDRDTSQRWDTDADDYVAVSPETWGEAVRSFDIGPGWGDYLNESIHEYFQDEFDLAEKRLAGEVTA